MFRRFMIVCWVLFAVCALGSAAGLALGYYLQNQIDTQNNLLGEVPEITAEQLVDEWRAESEGAGGKAAKERIREKARLRHQLEILENRQSSSFVVGLGGLILSAGLLLWNIICHVGHWVWMGRKEQ